VYDDLILKSTSKGGNYPKAKETDAFIKLYENNQNDFDLNVVPEKYLIVTSNQTSTDLLIDKFETVK